MLGRGRRTLEAWSSRYEWVERAAAYTDHLDRLMLATHEEEIVRRRREVNERIYETAQALHALAVSRIYGVEDEEQPVAAIDPNTLDIDDVIRSFESGAKWGRFAIGLPASVTGSTTITLNDLQFTLRGFFRLTEKRMPRAEFEALVRDVACSRRGSSGLVSFRRKRDPNPPD